MSGTLIIVTGVIYLCVSIEQFAHGNNAMACVYAGYSFSNVGLWILAK